LVDDLTRALRILASDMEMLNRLSDGARRRAERFSRDKQVSAIDSLYDAACRPSRGRT